MKNKTCICELLFLLFLVAIIEPVQAVPANPTPFTFIQPDKSSFQVIQVGDERGAHFETMEGYTIVTDENNWWNYARKDTNGKLVSTGQRVGLSDPKILGVKTHLHPAIKVTELLIGDDLIPDNVGFVQSKISKPERAPQTGTKKALVILINFTDISQDPGSTSPYYRNLLFNASPGANSMNNYFKEVSYNKINITGDIAGNQWFRASNNLAWHGADGACWMIDSWSTCIDTDETLPNPNDWYIFKLAKEAVIAADPYVNYAQYDYNSDGIIDNLIIVHSGKGQESSGVSTDIWSHKWSIYTYSGDVFNLGYLTNDGVKAVGYTMLAEDSPLGTFAHEYGHDLGLPDLYDFDDSNGESEGIGVWGLMGSGNWLGRPPGSSPSHLSAWSKYFLGWVNPIKVTSTLLNKQLNQVETNDEVYMILDNPGDTPGYLDWSLSGAGKGEYFLVENRNKTGFDAYLPGKGLLIWHIDESRENNDDETHKLVDLEEADGLNDLDNNTNRGDANDPWYNNITGFTEATIPNSNFYNGSASGVRVSDISAFASIMTANLILGWPAPIISFVSPTPGNNSSLNQNWVYVNITSDETLNIALLEWNGTNETMLGSGTTWYKNKTNLAEGVYTYKVWANDSAGNFNVSETRYVMIDQPPSITFVTPTPGNNSLLNSNWVYVNITSDQTLNSVLLEWNGTNETMAGSGINWYKNNTVLPDGSHSYRVWGNDSTNNWNATEIRKAMIDTSPPVITISYPGNNSSINIFDRTIRGSITDTNSIKANLSVGDQRLDWTAPGNFRWIANYSPGLNYINITVTDSYNNTNISTTIVNVMSTNETDQNIPNGTSVNIKANKSTGLDLVLTADNNNSANVNVSINASINANFFNATNIANDLGRYVEVNVTGDRDNLTMVQLTMFYNHSDLDYNDNGPITDVGDLNEDTLNLYWYWDNATGSQVWWPLTDNADLSSKIDRSNHSGPRVIGAVERNATANYVRVTLNHFSLYSLSGSLVTAPSTPTLSSGGGGGGGGGGSGGASGENYSNIEVSEKYDLAIYKDKVTSYMFTNNSSPIMFINITGNVSFGEITTSVEYLRNISTMVKTRPPGIIYKNANIWVGSSSFNSPRNIKHGAIRFRVLNSWIKENNIASVRMVKWNKIDWEYLQTNEVSKDDVFTYYDAFAQVFSNFAITGTKEGTKIQEIKSVTLAEANPGESAPVIETTEPTKKNPGFGSILVIFGLLGVYVLRRARE